MSPIWPANTVKISFEFNQQSELVAAWTESYWLSGQTLQAALSKAQLLLPWRVGCLGNGITAPLIRATSMPAGNRVVAVAPGIKTPGSGQLNASAGEPRTKGLLRLVNTLGSYTQQWLGGINDTSFVANGIYSPSPAFKAALAAFLFELYNLGFCTKQLTQTGAFAKKPILSISAAGVFTVTAHGFTQGQAVSIQRVPSGFGLRGIWPINFIDANTFSLIGGPTLTAAVNVTKVSAAQLVGYTLTAINSNTAGASSGNQLSGIMRATAHEVGRPSPLYIGRRKIRKR